LLTAQFSVKHTLSAAWLLKRLPGASGVWYRTKTMAATNLGLRAYSLENVYSIA